MTALLHTPTADAAEASVADPLAHVLRAFRASVPCDGVVLATPDGACLAHDLDDAADPARAAREAAADLRARRARSRGAKRATSAFVEGPEGLTLVVFVDPATGS